MSDTGNIAVANNLYSYYSNLPFILDNLERDMKNYLYWFKNNSLRANYGEFQFMILESKNRFTHSLYI